MSLSKNKSKYIRSLKDKKNRSEYGTFVAEGDKMVSDLLAYLPCQYLACTQSVVSQFDLTHVEESVIATDSEIASASFLKNPQNVIAVFYQPDTLLDIDLSTELCLVLDGVQDPGNMGTIIRLADWYGIRTIYCSHDSADVYNPKVVQATMGALARVRVHYGDVVQFLSRNTQYPIYGTLLGGENIYDKQLTANGIIVMGSEGQGISAEVEALISNKLFLPNYPLGAPTSESLNVAIATAIVCAEFRRRSF